MKHLFNRTKHNSFFTRLWAVVFFTIMWNMKKNIVYLLFANDRCIPDSLRDHVGNWRNSTILSWTCCRSTVAQRSNRSLEWSQSISWWNRNSVLFCVVLGCIILQHYHRLVSILPGYELPRNTPMGIMSRANACRMQCKYGIF